MNGKQRAQWNEFRRQPCSENSDTEIAKRARSVLRWKIRYDSIQVTAEKGHLTLFGEVNWNLDREAAEQTVRKLSGVTGVTNLLTAKDCAESATFIIAGPDVFDQSKNVHFDDCNRRNRRSMFVTR